KWGVPLGYRSLRRSINRVHRGLAMPPFRFAEKLRFVRKWQHTTPSTSKRIRRWPSSRCPLPSCRTENQGGHRHRRKGHRLQWESCQKKDVFWPITFYFFRKQSLNYLHIRGRGDHTLVTWTPSYSASLMSPCSTGPFPGPHAPHAPYAPVAPT